MGKAITIVTFIGVVASFSQAAPPVKWSTIDVEDRAPAPGWKHGLKRAIDVEDRAPQYYNYRAIDVADRAPAPGWKPVLKRAIDVEDRAPAPGFPGMAGMA